MKMKIILLSISALDKKGCIGRTEIQHQYTVLCDMWCKKTFSLFPHEQDRNRSSESDYEFEHIGRDSIIQEDKDQDGVYQTNKDKYLNCHFLYI